ncbi:MAG TPA: xanthine dehydrogenase family protein molybdopterin-binding subunit [Methylomirabilota bacterium]|nr:xanthine dehydrogenase family protein molybdopterin-binding subunit [Methylomirabilota bacterium]
MTAGIVGTPAPRVDTPEKATGRARFITDVVVPGMLHARLWRSPVPHARILGVDTTRAAGAPGVVAVLTASDLPVRDLYYGPAFKDQPLLADGVIRYAGEPVAAVIADTPAHAEAALARIGVDYAELPVVATLEAALAPGAPLLHERPRPAGHFRDLGALRPIPGTNVCHHYRYARGDPSGALAEAELVVEQTYTFPMAHHVSLEPHCAIARVDRQGITVWASTQHPFPVRKELAEMFGVPLARLTVIVPYLGAAYGNKSYTKIEPLVIALAAAVGRTVRLALTAEEAFLSVRRAAVRYRLRTGVRRDGTLLAREAEIHYQLGAYADVGPRVVQKSAYTAAGPYRIPHVRIDAYGVYTNTVVSVAFRGYGVPQLAWAYESQMDVIAERLGMDPLELRLRNLLRRGETFIEGDLPIDCDLAGGLRQAAAAVGWSEPPRAPGRGKGLACTIKAPLAPSVSSAMVRLHADGSATLLTGTVECGQGVRTVLSQIVAEELALPLARVTVARPEAGMGPYDQATSASRSTTLMGLAVQAAARDVRDQLGAIAARRLGGERAAVTLRDGRIVGPGGELTYSQALAAHFGGGGELIGRGTYRGERGHAPLGGEAPFWEVGMAAAEVEVDAETGLVRVLRYVSVADIGRAINPRECHAQEEGGAMMGIGHTFFEQMVYDGGQLVNPSLIDYRVPGMGDVPDEYESILVENGDGPGPYGAKGIGESGLLPTAPAIANAVARAVGVRITDLPLTPERVRRAIVAAKGGSA